MSDQEFAQTGIGRRFYERDVPELVAVLKRIADSMEKLVEKIEELEKEGR